MSAPVTGPPAPPPQQERVRLRNQQLQRSKLLAVLVVVACLVVATIGLRLSDPDRDDGNYRVLVGELGKPMTLNDGQLTVSDVRVGQVLIDDATVEARTPGMFVQIQIDLANPTSLEKVILGDARLLTGDRSILPYRSLTVIGADPGYGETNDFLFEVDPSQLDDLTLEIWSQGFLSGYHDRARIHLGITAQNADRWREAAVGGILTERRIGETRVLR